MSIFQRELGIKNYPDIDPEEYDVLYNWYQEWVKICKLLATFAFSAIGFTILLINSSSKDVPIAQNVLEMLAKSWTFLGAGGVLCGISIMFAYMWLDAFSRGRAPTLVGKAITKSSFPYYKYYGLIGWSVTLVAAALVASGLSIIITASKIQFGI